MLAIAVRLTHTQVYSSCKSRLLQPIGADTTLVRSNWDMLLALRVEWLDRVYSAELTGGGWAQAHQQGRHDRSAVLRGALRQDRISARNDEPQEVCTSGEKIFRILVLW